MNNSVNPWPSLLILNQDRTLKSVKIVQTFLCKTSIDNDPLFTRKPLHRVITISDILDHICRIFLHLTGNAFRTDGQRADLKNSNEPYEDQVEVEDLMTFQGSENFTIGDILEAPVEGSMPYISSPSVSTLGHRDEQICW